MTKNLLALALVVSSAITSFITYDMSSYEGGHANVIAFTLSMYILSVSTVYCYLKMRSLFKCS